MQKERYYVSVQSRSIVRDQGATPYEFEIDATDDEVEQLTELFDWKRNTEEGTLIKSVAPGVQYHNDAENDVHDEVLQQIYKKIHQLGTVQTKQHIQSMGLTGMTQSMD